MSVGGVEAKISMSQNTEKYAKSPLWVHRYLSHYIYRVTLHAGTWGKDSVYTLYVYTPAPHTLPPAPQ